jgi:hypothetical protein
VPQCCEALQPRPEHRRAPHLGDDRLCAVRVGLLLGDHPRRHPERAQGPGGGRVGAGHELRPGDAPGGAAPGLPQHGAAAAHPGHRAVPGYVAGLCVGAGRLLRRAYKVGDRDGRLVELLLFAGAVYFASALRPRSWCAATKNSTPTWRTDPRSPT